MLNFVHIGIGQCGNRLAEQFGKNGRIAIAVNTARVDMYSLDSKAISPKNQIHIALSGNTDGAGRNPEIGRESMEKNLDNVYAVIQQATKNVSVARFVLWAGLGGGTGTGGVLPLMNYLIAKGHKVMLGLTIPREKEGWEVRMNAVKALSNIIQTLDEDRKNVVPYLIIDNEQFSGGLASQNESIVRDLVRFTNTTSNTPADSAFDDMDFARVLNLKGVLSVVRNTIPTDGLKGIDSLAKIVQESWKKSLLVDIDPADAMRMVNLVIVPSRFYKAKGNYELISDSIQAIESLSPQANPYSCIYEAKNDSIDRIIVYTMLTGLPSPDAVIDDIYEDVNKKIMETKERRKELKVSQRQSQEKRQIVDFDPNDIDW